MIALFHCCNAADSTHFFWHYGEKHLSATFIMSFLAFSKLIFWSSLYLEFFENILCNLLSSTILRFSVKNWQYYWSLKVESLEWHDTEDISPKMFSLSLLEINFSLLKADKLIGCLRLCTAVGYTKSCRGFFKRG